MVTTIDVQENSWNVCIYIVIQLMYGQKHGTYKQIENHKKLFLGSCKCTYEYGLKRDSTYQ